MATHTIELRRPFGPLSLSIDGKRVRLANSTKIRNHSPTGFAWGYNGSGPAQTALAILLATVGRELAERHYQAFKAEVIARFEQDVSHSFRIDVDAWIKQHAAAKA